MNWAPTLAMFGTGALLFLVAAIANRLGQISNRWAETHTQSHNRNSLGYQIRMLFILALGAFFFVLGFVLLSEVETPAE